MRIIIPPLSSMRPGCRIAPVLQSFTNIPAPLDTNQHGDGGLHKARSVQRCSGRPEQWAQTNTALLIRDSLGALKSPVPRLFLFQTWTSRRPISATERGDRMRKPWELRHRHVTTTGLVACGCRHHLTGPRLAGFINRGSSARLLRSPKHFVFISGSVRLLLSYPL